ncbi:MAG: hypothetical protein IPN13_22035 [Bacteroidetes bacterium]|nr:hypothetical protein [Bacteroidota bacterium]
MLISFEKNFITYKVDFLISPYENNSTRGLFDEEFRLEKIASKDPLSILSTKVNWEQFRSTEKAFDEERN